MPTNSILIVRPANFVYNFETAISNAFQNELAISDSDLQEKILQEFDQFAQKLIEFGVDVTIVEDTAEPIKPDAIFPNNWVTFHNNGIVILYPMKAVNRRDERRPDIIQTISRSFEIKQILDLSDYEKENWFLEGTGSIIFDHLNKIAYACLSPRTDEALFKMVCQRLGYQAISFYSVDENGKEIYHTNVMMCIAEKFAVVCLESIADDTEKKNVMDSLTSTGLKIIDISQEQVNNFAGNMLELKGKEGNVLVMSQSAFDALNDNQKAIMRETCQLLPMSIPTIETIGGGSARCMIAEIFLPRS